MLLGPGQEGTAHHRRPRGKGGTRQTDVDSLANLLLLCGGALGGVCGCHGGVEASRTEAFTRGWLVHQGTDPATVLALLNNGRTLVLLHPDYPFYLPLPHAA